jgi:hypothetical protein
MNGYLTIYQRGQGILRRSGGAYFTWDSTEFDNSLRRMTEMPSGKIFHTRNLATTMDMPMILTLEEIVLRNNQTCNDKTLYNNRQQSLSTRDVASRSNTANGV